MASFGNPNASARLTELCHKAFSIARCAALVELPLRKAVPIPSSISIRFFANFIQPLPVETRLLLPKALG
jgi:hypothetical protein